MGQNKQHLCLRVGVKLMKGETVQGASERKVARFLDQHSLCISLCLGADGKKKRSLSHKTSSKSSRRMRLPVIAVRLDYPWSPRWSCIFVFKVPTLDTKLSSSPQKESKHQYSESKNHCHGFNKGDIEHSLNLPSEQRSSNHSLGTEHGKVLEFYTYTQSKWVWNHQDTQHC